MITQTPAGPETAPPVTYERARLMLADASPAFTTFVEETVQTETNAYKKVMIQTDHPTEVSLTAFATGLGYYFSSERYTHDPNTGSFKQPILNVARLALKRLKDPSDRPLADKSNFIQYAVKDSLEFGSVFVGTVADRLSKMVTDRGFEASPQEILRRDDFHTIINGLARTGFNFYGQGILVRPELLPDFVASKLDVYGLQGKQVFEELFDVDSEGLLVMKQVYIQRLKDNMKMQNQRGFINRTSGMASADLKLTTAGCPVAHSPRGAGNKPTGISTFIYYIADQYDRYLDMIDNWRSLPEVNRRVMMMGLGVKAVHPAKLGFEQKKNLT